MADEVTIPVAPGMPNQTFRTTLDGVAYRFAVRWNATLRGWFVDLSLSDGTPLVLGKGLRAGSDVLAQKRYDPRVPQGILTVLPLKAAVDPGLDSWGVTHVLLYLPPEE